MKHRITDPATDRRHNRGIIGLDPILTRSLVTRMHNVQRQKQSSTRRRAAFAHVTGWAAICKNVKMCLRPSGAGSK